MAGERDVDAFGLRAATYDEGPLGRFHHEVAQRVATIAASVVAHPRRVLDLGCGSGYLLSLLAQRYPASELLVGVDAASAMVQRARHASSDPRIQVVRGGAEQLPFEGGTFDLVVSTTSFDHWRDQRAGLEECARVVGSPGTVVVADLFSPLLRATLIGSRRDKARTRTRAERLLVGAGLQVEGWQKVHTLIHAVVAHST